jgi:hypothetical protein
MKKIFQKFILVPTIFCALLVASNFVAPGVTHAAPVHTNASTHAVTMTTSRTASPLATATTCYGGEVLYGPFSLHSNSTYLWPVSAPWFQTSGRCQDINVNFTELTAPMQMQVCFENISKPYCNSWKTVSHTGTWYQIATSVLAGTDFRFGIKTTSAVTYKVYVAI